MADGSAMPGGIISHVQALVIDPTVTTTVYAAADYRVAKSVDSGVTWDLAGWPQYSTDMVYSLAKAPSAAVLYAAGTERVWGGSYYYYYARVFRSTDGGASWLRFSAPTEGFHNLAVDPGTSTTLYAGNENGSGVYKSTNGGVNWLPANSGLTNLSVRALAIDPAAPATLYAGTGSGVFKSLNGGESWTEVNGGLTNTAVLSLAIDPDTPATLYAGTNGGGVFQSINGGESWTAVNAGLTNAYVTSLTIASAAPAMLYAGTHGGVFKTPLPSESRLQGLVLDAGSGAVALSPAFGTNTLNYTATVQSASVTLAPMVWNNDATITVNGTPVASGAASGALPLDAGSNTLSVVVTSGDETSTRTYTVDVTRQVIAPAAPTGVQALLGAPGSGQATVSWTPSASSGSSALMGYTVNGGSGCTAGPGDSSCVVSGLVDGTAYTFTVRAANAEGATATSSVSNSVTPMASCTFNGMPVLHGGSVTAFAQSSVPFGSTCQQQTRTCSNGALSGSYTYATCSVSAAASCTFNGGAVTHGQSITAYLNAAEPAGGSCAAESRSCFNGTLSGSHTHATCRVAPGAPTGVRAVPIGSGQVTVTWQAPADAGSGITGYLVTAQPGGQTCSPSPTTTTDCTLAGLNDGQTYTFTVQAFSGSAGGDASPTPSNPATPLANSKQFSAASPTGTGTVGVAVAGGGATCAFESVQLLSAASAGAPATRSFTHGVLDFVLHACDAMPVTVTITYPPGTPLQGAQYWKRQGGAWGPFAATLGANTAVLTLTDGGAGDDDGVAVPNGRIVDPGGVSVLAGPGPGGATAIPTLNEWGLALLVTLLGWVAFTRRGRRV